MGPDIDSKLLDFQRNLENEQTALEFVRQRMLKKMMINMVMDI